MIRRAAQLVLLTLALLITTGCIVYEGEMRQIDGWNRKVYKDLEGREYYVAKGRKVYLDTRVPGSDTFGQKQMEEFTK